ncbi:hypothetical protein HHX47_DHR2000720 [Lentinula edodes]|nr:hypothetical protein HHX47_DHR2000720 [Lentinula edodes]
MSASQEVKSGVSGALIFDLMGTCTNWSASVVAALKKQCANTPLILPKLQSDEDLTRFASAWRAGFFREIHQRFQNGEPQEDIDITHRRVLDQLLSEKDMSVTTDIWGDDIRTILVQSWHHQNGVGIKTAYIHRTTEDPEEDMQQVRSECDIFVSGTDGSTSCGLNELADILCSPSNNASRLDLED